MSAAEERKLVTVLFADLVGSTAYAGDRDPERVRVQLQRFYDAMRAEIELTGGTVEKFAGDAVMAVFGTPASLEDHAERALHAGLAMQQRMRELFGGGLELRIGVNTGVVVSGTSRESSSFVTGDAVNVAGRLEQAAAPGEVLAGERTVAAVGAAFEFGPLRMVEAKGKRDGVACRPVLRALTLMRPRGASGMRRVFVGREAELDLLLATFRRVSAQGEPHLVSIVGEPGVGKTRLIRELYEALSEEEPSPIRRTGRCLPYGDGITYWPVGEVLKEHLALLESDPPEEIRRRLGDRQILGLALGLEVATRLHPLEAREQLHDAVVSFVEGLAAERTLVLLVEDIHWGEDDLLDLLERIVAEARAPILLLATARPELLDRRAGWGGGRRNSTLIWLDPLPARVTESMLDELVGLELPAAVRELVVERTAGNPFFVEELVGELVDTGILRRSDDGWSVGELPTAFVAPDTVRAVIAARIDRLPANEKAALQAAAVVGRVFWPSHVVHLLGDDVPDFDLLEERDFIRRRGPSTMAGEREYAVKHALTREVAYASIPKARRGRLHAALADWLVASDPSKDEHASLLAYHYAEAVRPDDVDLAWANEPHELDRLRAQAVRWLRRAADMAAARCEMDEAVELLGRAVDLTDDEHERALLWREIGYAQALRYDGEAFWAAVERSLEGPLDDAERAGAYGLLAFQTSIRSGMWAVRPQRDDIEDWVERALELAPPLSEARARALLARAHIDPSVASEELLQSIDGITAELEDPDLRSFALAVRSHASFERFRFTESAEWADRRLELATEIDDPDGLCEIYESSVPVAVVMGSFVDADRLAQLHWDIAKRLSIHHRVHSISLGLETADALGDWAAIVARTDEMTEAVSRNLDTPCVRNPRDLLLSSLAHWCTGSEDRSRSLESEANALMGQGHERELNPVRLRLALVRRETDHVRELVSIPFARTFVWGPAVFGTLLDALAALRDRDRLEREAPVFLEEETVVEPFALRALGIVRGDDELLALADQRFAALGLVWHRAQTERLLAGV